MNYIIKTIQGCNLSCIYCYERSHNRLNLAMDFDDATGFMRKVFDYYRRNNPEEILAFHWHGGEPMLMGARFFERIFEFQAEVLGSGIRWYNTIQTNLTLLTDAFIELLDKYRHSVVLGISFDFFGDDRVDQNNRNVNARVWRNVGRLQKSGLPINFLTMITKGNVGHLGEIYDRVRSRDVCIRFNQVFDVPKKRPFDRSPVRLRNSQFSEAMQSITRRWLADRGCRITIDNAVRIGRKILDPGSTHMCWYERDCLEHHMAICPDGTVFPCDSFYVKGFSYGNIFHDPYERILASKPRRRLLKQQEKIHGECRGCEFLEYCNGGCPTRAMVSMPRGRVRVRKDPMCAMHRALFDMIGQHLVHNGLLEPDWTASRVDGR